MPKVMIYTDGAARGNPDGPGGYGAVISFTDSKGETHEKELSAGYKKKCQQDCCKRYDDFFHKNSFI